MGVSAGVHGATGCGQVAAGRQVDRRRRGDCHPRGGPGRPRLKVETGVRLKKTERKVEKRILHADSGVASGPDTANTAAASATG